MTKGQDERLKLDHQLCFPLYAASRNIVKRYTPFFRPLGITYTQYIVFMALWEKDGETVGELGERLFLDTGTLTPLLKKMEQAGYLTRTRESRDERVVTIRLTQQGRDMKEKCAEIPEKIGGCIRLSPEEAGALYRLLHKLLET
ncbi:MarR family winged helix-turn-helix transcriptional regulator [Lachnoclostridium sp. Marseille-P6806]|uniref:MarR family winged helix-turn-helix transcriptional regulator n=1 Tax=Lachnoclostridium sp. Marseille-P6806 TaxID=2364793 RepID=UPI00103241FC|nr:MarR family transcriptional regulator [Lachnoclostridium sp. Marseille-P6806]